MLVADGFAAIQALLNFQRGVDLADGVVDMLEGLAVERGTSLFQQRAGSSELLVRDTLFFVSPAVAPDVHFHQVGGSFDLFHGLGAMALVVMIGHGEGGVGLAEQTLRAGRFGADALAYEQRPSQDGDR
jgi:hypothetical protein